MSQHRKIRRNRRGFAVIPGGKATPDDMALATPTHRFGMALDKFIHDYIEHHHAEVSPPETCKVMLEMAAILALKLPGMNVDMEQWLMLCEHVLDEQMKALGMIEPAPDAPKGA